MYSRVEERRGEQTGGKQKSRAEQSRVECIAEQSIIGVLHFVETGMQMLTILH